MIERPLNLLLEVPGQANNMQRLPSIMPSSAILEGYQDCTEEAIRYLIEVEKLPADDPMVVGLRDHLFEKQKSFSFSNISDCPMDLPNIQPHLFAPQPVYYDTLGQYEDYVLRSDNISDNSSDSNGEVFNITSQVDVTQNTDFYNVSNLCASENESAIRSLAEELLSLMEADEDFFSEYDDDEDDEEHIDYDDSIEDIDQ